MMSTENIPINATDATECSAGCFAKIKVPIAKTVVKTARIIEVRYVGSTFFPVVFSFISACVRKMLKSTPTPKTKVHTIVLKIFSCIPKKYRIPAVTIPVKMMGTIASIVSSTFLKNTNRIRTIAISE